MGALRRPRARRAHLHLDGRRLVSSRPLLQRRRRVCRPCAVPAKGAPARRVLEQLCRSTSRRRPRPGCGRPSRAAARIAGFGHRAYRMPDPRVPILREAAAAIARRPGREDLFAVWRGRRRSGDRVARARRASTSTSTSTARCCFHLLGADPPLVPLSLRRRPDGRHGRAGARGPGRHPPLPALEPLRRRPRAIAAVTEGIDVIGDRCRSRARRPTTAASRAWWRAIRAIAEIDGVEGRLVYRGYAIEDLVAHACFEEVTHLILFGELPATRPSRRVGRAKLRALASASRRGLRALARVPRPRPSAGPVPHDAHRRRVPHPGGGEHRARRPVAAAGAHPELDGGARRRRHPAPRRASTPSRRATTWGTPRTSSGRPWDACRSRRGRAPSTRASWSQAEHGLHAAALAALTVISTRADLGSAVLAGMGALSGARHGGANQLAFEMLAESRGAGRGAGVGPRRRSPAATDSRGSDTASTSARTPGDGPRAARATLCWWLEGMETLWDTYRALREEVEAALGPEGYLRQRGQHHRPALLPASGSR